MKKSKYLLKYGHDKSYKLYCSLLNWLHTIIENDLFFMRVKRTKREEIYPKHYILKKNRNKMKN